MLMVQFFVVAAVFFMVFGFLAWLDDHFVNVPKRAPHRVTWCDRHGHVMVLDRQNQYYCCHCCYTPEYGVDDDV